MSNKKFKNSKITDVIQNTEIQEQLKKAWEYNLEHGTDFSMIRFIQALTELLKDAVGITKGISAVDNTWREEVREQFSGRGAKWVYVALTEVEEFLKKFEENGDDVSSYREFINKKGKAWVRYSGSRIYKNQNAAAFEVRVFGNKIDHPKHLMYLPVTQLQNLERLNSTPHKLGLENPVEEQKVETETDEVETETDEVETNEVDVSEPPTSNDPEEWQEWLKQNSLEEDEFDGETIYLDEAFEELE